MAGPHRIQPIFEEVPAPTIPTGLYARHMDPIALASLGFTRDHVVCAALVPAPDEATDVEARVADLVEAHDELSRQVASGPAGACACDAARRLGVEALVAGCERRPVSARCADDDRATEALAGLRDELAAHLSGAPMPWIHVRMAGRTDRPGWFSRHASELVPRHPGPSDVFLRGQKLDGNLELAFVEHALAEPDVVAVVRQDLGQAFLVVREVGDALVLDHFTYPLLPASRRGLVRLWEQVNPEAIRNALARPERGLVYDHDPRTASVAVLDVPGLLALDRQVAAAGALDGRARSFRAPLDDRPTPLADRAVVYAPFGTEGMEVRARLSLSETGRVWAQTLPEGPASPTLTELGMPPVLVTPPADAPFVFVGRCAESWWAHGPKAVGPYLAALERAHPGAVGGTFDALEVTVTAPLPPSWKACDDGTRRLLERFEAHGYRLDATFDPPREHLDVTLRPRP